MSRRRRTRLLGGVLAALLTGPVLAVPGPAQAGAGTDTLREGEVLTSEPGQSLRSSNGQHVLSWALVPAQTTGVLVLAVRFGPDATFSQSFPVGSFGAHRLVMQSDGNLVAYDPGGRAVWASSTFTTEDVRLVLQDDGRLTIRTAGDRVLWTGGVRASRMRAGFLRGSLTADQSVLRADGYLSSPDGRYRLVMQRDGNLVLYAGSGRAVFATATSGGPDSVFVAQADGNLVVYDGGRAVWASATHQPRPGQHFPSYAFVVQDDGNVVQYADTGRPLWASRSGRLS